MGISGCFAREGGSAGQRGGRRLRGAPGSGGTVGLAPAPMGHPQRLRVMFAQLGAWRGGGEHKGGPVEAIRGDWGLRGSPPGPRAGRGDGNFSPTPHPTPICRARELCPRRGHSPRGPRALGAPHLEPETPSSGTTPRARGTRPPAPHLQRREITGRRRPRLQRGAEGSGGGGQDPLRTRGADAAPAAAAPAREPSASPAARRHRIRIPGRGRAGGGASLRRLRPDPEEPEAETPTPLHRCRCRAGPGRARRLP